MNAKVMKNGFRRLYSLERHGENYLDLAQQYADKIGGYVEGRVVIKVEAVNAPDYEGLSYPNLKALAKDRGLETGGKKPELVERLKLNDKNMTDQLETPLNPTIDNTGLPEAAPVEVPEAPVEGAPAEELIE